MFNDWVSRYHDRQEEPGQTRPCGTGGNGAVCGGQECRLGKHHGAPQRRRRKRNKSARTGKQEAGRERPPLYKSAASRLPHSVLSHPVPSSQTLEADQKFFFQIIKTGDIDRTVGVDDQVQACIQLMSVFSVDLAKHAFDSVAPDRVPHLLRDRDSDAGTFLTGKAEHGKGSRSRPVSLFIDRLKLPAFRQSTGCRKRLRSRDACGLFCGAWQ